MNTEEENNDEGEGREGKEGGREGARDGARVVGRGARKGEWITESCEGGLHEGSEG